MSDLDTLRASALSSIEAAATTADIEQLRVQLLGKKGAVTELLKGLGKLSAEERPAAGAAINQLKEAIGDALNRQKEALSAAEAASRSKASAIDVTLPGRAVARGAMHPVSRVLRRIESFFTSVGYEVVEGPEIEDDYHNFEALNIPAHHPARAMHDTFYFSDSLLLRTHTSPVQVRTMETREP
ncbi:MAG: phenylalanine--tRNA ligase subunit alpha, partial [Pseudomonadales bacterium]